MMDRRVAEQAEGVDIRRSIGGDQLALLDPILLLGYPRVPHLADAE
jgi:hypothetical protein